MIENEIVKTRGTEMQAVSPIEKVAVLFKEGMTPEFMRGMLEVQMEWERNEARKAYHVAMVNFKENPPQIVKDMQVSYKAGGGTTSYKHASLSTVTKAISTSLSKHGLSASWQTAQNGSVSVTCKITHIHGHSEETTLSAQADGSGSKNSIQAIGSTITYLQRYTLLALTGLAASDQDDDGQASEPVEVIDDKQLSTSRDYIDNDSTFEMDKFLSYMTIESLETMPKAKYQQVIVAFQQRETQKKSKFKTVDVVEDVK